MDLETQIRKLVVTNHAFGLMCQPSQLFGPTCSLPQQQLLGTVGILNNIQTPESKLSKPTMATTQDPHPDLHLLAPRAQAYPACFHLSRVRPAALPSVGRFPCPDSTTLKLVVLGSAASSTRPTSLQAYGRTWLQEAKHGPSCKAWTWKRVLVARSCAGGVRCSDVAL